MSNSFLKNIIDNLKDTRLARAFLQDAINKKSPELEDLIAELEHTRNSLESARSNFEYARDKEMVEYYTYIIMANEVKFGYLTKKYQELKQGNEYSEDLILVPEELKERRAL